MVRPESSASHKDPGSPAPPRPGVEGHPMHRRKEEAPVDAITRTPSRHRAVQGHRGVAGGAGRGTRNAEREGGLEGYDARNSNPRTESRFACEQGSAAIALQLVRQREQQADPPVEGESGRDRGALRPGRARIGGDDQAERQDDGTGPPAHHGQVRAPPVPRYPFTPGSAPRRPTITVEIPSCHTHSAASPASRMACSSSASGK